MMFLALFPPPEFPFYLLHSLWLSFIYWKILLSFTWNVRCTMAVEAIHTVVLPMARAFKAQIAKTQPWSFPCSRPGEGLRISILRVMPTLLIWVQHVENYKYCVSTEKVTFAHNNLSRVDHGFFLKVFAFILCAWPFCLLMCVYITYMPGWVLSHSREGNWDPGYALHQWNRVINPRKGLFYMFHFQASIYIYIFTLCVCICVYHMYQLHTLYHLMFYSWLNVIPFSVTHEILKPLSALLLSCESYVVSDRCTSIGLSDSSMKLLY